MSRHVVVMAALLAVATASPAQNRNRSSGTTSKKTVVCWTDDRGARACGDSVPPEFAKNEKKVLNQTGRVVRTIPAALTPEEREAQRIRDEQAAEAQREADQQAAYDRALLATYSRPEELAALRNDRLATLDATANINEKALSRDEDQLIALRGRLPADGTPVPPKLAKQVADFEKTLAKNRASVADVRRKREVVCATFARDIERFQQLKFGEVTYVSECPPASGRVPGADVEARIAGAQKLFEGIAALAHARSPDLFKLYAEDAVIRYAYPSSSGKPEQVELSRDDYRSEMVEAWKKAPAPAAGAETQEFANLSFEAAEKGGARVSGTRITAAGQAGTKFYVVARPNSAGEWQVVEQWSEARF